MSEFNKAILGILQFNSQISHAKQKLLPGEFYRQDFDILHAPCPIVELRAEYEASPLECTQIKLFGMIGAVVGGAVFSIFSWLVVYGVIQNFPLHGPDDLLHQILTVVFGFLVGMAYGAASGVLIGIGTSRNLKGCNREQVHVGNFLMLPLTALTTKSGKRQEREKLGDPQIQSLPKSTKEIENFDELRSTLLINHRAGF